MSGETEERPSGWTTDTLSTFVQRLLEERHEGWNQRFQAQERAIALAHEVDIRQHKGELGIISARLDGVEHAQQQFNDSIIRVPTDLDKQISGLKELIDEKFNGLNMQTQERMKGIDLRFAERDVRSEREARDDKLAVESALAAAKEAVAEQNRSSSMAISKSENSTTKQIDQIGIQITTITKATDDKIDDIKADLSQRRGVDSQSARQTQFSQWTVGTIIFVVSLLISVTVAIVSHLH